MADAPVIVDPKNSILTSVKKLLGIDESRTEFDIDIIIYINSTLAILSQIIGDETIAFIITDKTALWSDYISDTYKQELIKLYVLLKVRLLFDPPTIGSVLDSTNKLIAEQEFRILVATDPKPVTVLTPTYDPFI